MSEIGRRGFFGLVGGMFIGILNPRPSRDEIWAYWAHVGLVRRWRAAMNRAPTIDPLFDYDDPAVTSRGWKPLDRSDAGA